MLNDIKKTLKNQQDTILLVVRIVVAVVFIQAGWGKLSDIQQTAGYFGSIGIPMPFLNAILASVTEFVGGIHLLVGFQTRLVSIPLAFTMLVALLTAHLGEITSISALFNQKPLHFLLFFLIFATVGAGKISLDAKMGDN
jgi:putative oxidoreductase